MPHNNRMPIACLVMIATTFSAAAHAYLDPGTGSILLQGLLAGIAGALTVGSLYWRRLKSFFTRGRRSDSSGAADEQTKS